MNSAEMVKTFLQDRPVMEAHDQDKRSISILLGAETDELIDAVKTGDQKSIATELADVYWFLLKAADVFGVDLDAELAEKCARNHLKYPASEFQSGDYDEVVSKLKVAWMRSEGDKQFYSDF